MLFEVIKYSLTVGISLLAGFATAAMVFSVAPSRQMIFSVGRYKTASRIALVCGIILIVVLFYRFMNGTLSSEVLIICLLFSTFFIGLAVALSGSNELWEQINRACSGDDIRSSSFDLCYQTVDFDFIYGELSKLIMNPEDLNRALSKILVAYRNRNLYRLERFILITEIALRFLPKDDPFWSEYIFWGLDPLKIHKIDLFIRDYEKRIYAKSA
jgi:hypothetical protein